MDSNATLRVTSRLDRFCSLISARFVKNAIILFFASVFNALNSLNRRHASASVHRLVKLPDDKFEKMKLIVALAATAQAFVGPTARLPSASVGRTLQVKAQPNMLLGGLRARANNLVPTRRPSAEVPSA